MEHESAKLIAFAIRDLANAVEGIGIGLFVIAFVLFFRMIYAGR